MSIKSVILHQSYKTLWNIKSILYLILLLSFQSASCQQQVEWLTFKPEKPSANVKKIVFISGDEEYRSEESLPMLAKILSKHHGFQSVVLFAINPETKTIDPNYQQNIPGLQQLEDADLMVIATRFRELPDQQMKYVDDYLKKGKPVVGLRTATHAFNFSENSKSSYKHYSFNESKEPWKGGFGKVVLGETWVNHHGEHGVEGTRGLINGLEVVNNNPILKGIKDIWGPSDVYGLTPELTDATILVYGQSTNGMNDKSEISWEKPILPVAWTKPYKIEGGQTGKAFTTTMGAAVDFLSEDFRRLTINACLWLLDSSHLITEQTNVEFTETYNPTMFGFGEFKKGLKPHTM